MGSFFNFIENLVPPRWVHIERAHSQLGLTPIIDISECWVNRIVASLKFVIGEGARCNLKELIANRIKTGRFGQHDTSVWRYVILSPLVRTAASRVFRINLS